MTRMKRLLAVAALLALAPLGQTACGDDDDDGGGAGGGETVNVYSSLPLQGGQRLQTTAMVNGIKQALEEHGGKALPRIRERNAFIGAGTSSARPSPSPATCWPGRSGRATRRRPTRPAPRCRSRAASSRRSRPAKRRAATSAASNRPPCHRLTRGVPRPRPARGRPPRSARRAARLAQCAASTSSTSRTFLPKRRDPPGVFDRAAINAAHRRATAAERPRRHEFAAAARGRGSRVAFPGQRRAATLAVDGIDLLARARAHARRRRRVRLRQDRHLARHHGAPAEGRRRGRGRACASRARDLLTQPDRVLRDLRGDRLAMIFQEPMTSLNPSYTVGDQIVEALRAAPRASTARGARRAPSRCCDACASRRREARFHDYPHQLSGGMRQRVMIAMALACDPDLLIADEPTTALDVTIQAQILDLMRELREESGAAILLITHDLGVVAEVCDEVVVMYAGQVVERAPAARCSGFPQHPYTVGLLGALPRLDRRAARASPRSRARCPNWPRRRTAAASRRAAPSASPLRRDAAARAGRRRAPRSAAGGRRWRGLACVMTAARCSRADGSSPEALRRERSALRACRSRP